MTTPFLLCAIITAISAIVSFGYSVAAVRAESGQAQITALYAFARSLALVIVSVAVFEVGSTMWLAAAACCMVIVQACDAAIGFKIADRLKTVGPASTAIINLAALIWLLGGY